MEWWIRSAEAWGIGLRMGRKAEARTHTVQDTEVLRSRAFVTNAWRDLLLPGDAD